MKFNWLAILLLFSIAVNLIITVQIVSRPDSKDPRQTAYGISSTIQLLYSEIEGFNSSYTAYQNGDLEKVQFIEQTHKIAFDINNLGLVLESYEVIPLEYFQSVYKLSYYFSDFDKKSDAYNSELIAHINLILKENSNAKIYSIYKDYPGLLEGNIPDELKNLLVELDKCMETGGGE